ncbi:conserved hypothetical protein [Altererythrobacter sp. B11]|uniref:hypothetical protein n=1 Tax=Altererythrobacter sp. B11 TaxID=2060312 RepID=UPI000DC7258F|nr:hypothetical protein [Altererythrobacter sp. B11]BBC73122.1 conserved hypothetical protein [Altererythrobacter sp. B11]
MHPAAFAFAATALATIPVAAGAVTGEGENVPLIGRDGPEADGCGGIGKVFGLYGPGTQAYLSVRERQDDRAREKDRLTSGTLVWLCDAQDEWQGIVYADDELQDLGDCRVSSSVAAPEPYSGPCRFGWVHARNLQLVAQ